MKRLKAVNERRKKVSEVGGRQSDGGGDEGRQVGWESFSKCVGAGEVHLRGRCRFLINVWLLVRA